ncbi:sigma-70 family RNA polymerase sigma factor [Fibrisoma montanum]|uniref:Sigma-70 family RNA polymerase sigma factor n=1 Tax=Fibrisoma montanum TaxID=2305895 RepID=A0A418MEZ9_9BACT|nr:sigma-70 family RNA polymerase sigma factor [Fibrisoma montanum]RIV25374.1 sigma-70 family RNA polymerase sigma factor [Fibrisoma montanum]
MKSLRDEEVIETYYPSDPNVCFETLYTRYVNKVYRRCLSLTQDSAKAEDFTHDIFLKVFAKLDRFQQRSSFSTWLYSVSHNYCMDQIRLSKRLDTVAMESGQNEEYDLTDTEEAQEFDDRHQQLKRVMDVMAPEEKTMLQLKYEEGLSIDAIAERYQATPSAVKMRLKRSRDKAHRLYQQQYAE